MELYKPENFQAAFEYLQKVLSLSDNGIQKLYFDLNDIIKSSPGSSNNHQFWPGGYVSHVADTLKIAQELYEAFSEREKNFSLEQVWKVLLLHDIEKPIKYRGAETYSKLYIMTVQDNERELKQLLIKQYNIDFSKQEWDALDHIHGEGDAYRKDRRVMNELGAFCHTCDILSARLWHG